MTNPPVPQTEVDHLAALATAYRQEQTRIFTEHIQPILNRDDPDELIALYKWAHAQRVYIVEPTPEKPHNTFDYPILTDAYMTASTLIRYRHPSRKEDLYK